MKKWLSPPARGPAPLRVSSPPSGFSILITSAPMSDRIWVHIGPGDHAGEIDDADALEGRTA